MLKLCAVDFDNGVAIPEQDLSGSFDYVSLTRTSRPEEKHRAQRPSGISHPRLEDLIQRSDGANASILSDHSGSKSRLESLGYRALRRRIKRHQLSLSTIADHFILSFRARLSLSPFLSFHGWSL